MLAYACNPILRDTEAEALQSRVSLGNLSEILSKEEKKKEKEKESKVRKCWRSQNKKQ